MQVQSCAIWWHRVIRSGMEKSMTCGPTLKSGLKLTVFAIQWPWPLHRLTLTAVLTFSQLCLWRPWRHQVAELPSQWHCSVRQCDRHWFVSDSTSWTIADKQTHTRTATCLYWRDMHLFATCVHVWWCHSLREVHVIHTFETITGYSDKTCATVPKTFLV